LSSVLALYGLELPYVLIFGDPSSVRRPSAFNLQVFTTSRSAWRDNPSVVPCAPSGRGRSVFGKM